MSERRRKDDGVLVDVLGYIGFLSLAVGLFMLSVPWALVVLGVVLLSGSIAGTRLQEKEKEKP